MKKSLLTAIIISALLISLLAGMQIVEVVKAEPRTIVVPTDYSTIQGAINASIDGDTVFVRKGLYNETLVIEKSISLIGEDRNYTIIDARKANTQVIAIRGNNITVANFTLGNTSHHIQRNSGDSLKIGEGDGIVVFSSQYVNIINNTIIGCPIIGIYMYASTFPIGLNKSIRPNVNVIGNSILLGNTAIKNLHN
jgi:parallel beta-helix repeat protein